MKTNKTKNYSDSKTAKFADDALSQIGDTLDATMQELYGDVNDMRLFRAKVIGIARQSYAGMRENMQEAQADERATREAKREQAKQDRKANKIAKLREKLAQLGVK